MMFFFHTAFSLELLTLCAGAALYIWSLRNNGAGTTLARHGICMIQPILQVATLPRLQMELPTLLESPATSL